MDLIVTPGEGHRGTLRAFGAVHACALGRSGVRTDKHEGDGVTPAGVFELREIYHRSDRLALPAVSLRVHEISPDDGWCDDPGTPDYNRPVGLPYAGSAERLWREDGLYDLLVVLGHNDSPPVAGRGSAIFLHCASDDLGPTEGCVALPRDVLLDLVGRIGPGDRIEIRANRD